MKATNKTGWKTAMAIVVANMIGSGVFTSLGYQLEGTTNTWSILLLWVLGGFMALCGAVSYAELGTYFNRSGGEYHFLSKIFHPIIGYLSGWVSLTVGFAAPIALAAISIGKYSSAYLNIPSKIIAIGTVLLISFVHSISIKSSSQFQNISTLLKILFILFLIAAGIHITPNASALDFTNTWLHEIQLPAFAVSFVFVSYAYSGWNAAAYIVEEIDDAKNTLPKALIIGTLLVTFLYFGLNYIFLRQASLTNLQGTIEVGQVVAINMFGKNGGILISLAITLLLVSSISAMVWVGPRVTQVLGEDYDFWSYFSTKNKHHIPVRAIMLQAVISILFISTGTFDQVLVYSGFILQLFGALAVAGVFFVRKKQNNKGAFQSPFYPIPQIIFLVMSFWILAYLLYDKPRESLYGIMNLVLGLLSYFYNKYLH